MNSSESVPESTDSAFYDSNELSMMNLNNKRSSNYIMVDEISVGPGTKFVNNFNQNNKTELEQQLM